MIDGLRRALGGIRILEGDEGRHYGQDWTRQFPPAPTAVVFPDSIGQLQTVVRWANATNIALVPSGGRTGLSGGAVASNGEVVVSLERMAAVLDFDPVDRTLKVQAGVTTQQVQEAACANGLFYPVDFASRGSAQIGGNVATNAGGIKVLRYGLTRNWVAGLKVVAGNGEVLDLNRGLVKNATGYDLRHLFIGSEGTLGIIAEATLRLTDPPVAQQVMVLGVSRLDALMQVFSLLRMRLKLSAFEFFTDIALCHVLQAGAKRPLGARTPYYVLVEFDEDEGAALAAFETLIVNGFIADGVIGQSLAQNAELWRLREAITESIAHHRPYKNDISVRVALVPTFLKRVETLLAGEYPQFELVWFGHLGDGNLHISILQPKSLPSSRFEEECERVTQLLGEILREFGGSISAEHGVGLLKRPFLRYSRSEAEIQLMRELKRVFDPSNVMNRGKLI